MSRHRFLSLLLTALLVPALFACTEDQLGDSREAERRYVDLLYALHHGDQPASLRAVAAFDESVLRFGASRYRLLSEQKLDELFYRTESAERAYANARSSIREGYLALAAVQLDRATYEFRAAHPASFEELYVGSIYDFITSWLEVDYTVRDMDLCQQEWEVFAKHARNARVTWRVARSQEPSELLYAFTADERGAFGTARNELDAAVNAFIAELKNGDQCTAQAYAGPVTEALWDLLLLFGTGTTPASS